MLSALALLLILPVSAALGARGPISAVAKVVRGSAKVAVIGRTARNIPPNTWVSIYSADDNLIQYTARTDGKRAFNTTLQHGGGVIPCRLRLEVGGGKMELPVKGAPRSCKTAPSCAIAGPRVQKITEGQSVSLSPAPIKGKKKGSAPTYTWTVNDGSDPVVQVGLTREFKYSGQFKVTLDAVDAAGNQCSDDVIVSVAPPAGTNPYGKVPEQPAPGVSAGLAGDKGAYVVLPFEETGMLGGSMVNLPYNPLIPYNALNAQVIQKVEHKPAIIDRAALEVFYSAASNPQDPVSGDSINSTSQNLFADQQAGANFDPLSSIFGSDNVPADNKFIDGHDFRAARIKKNEVWDRMRQPNAALRLDASGAPTLQNGRSIADTQSTATPNYPLADPDQGMRGYVDDGKAGRRMPGAANPYRANDPQKMDYSDDQKAFVAQFIPASDYDDQGRVNPYPLFRVEAKDSTGGVLAKTDAVYTSASETRCRECHAPGKIAGDEDVWRMPVTEEELTDPSDPGKPGPATGANSFAPGSDPMKPWPPAIHNRFDDKIADNPAFTNLFPGANDPASAAYVPRDANGLRTDRVKASRWAEIDPATGKPTGNTSPVKPADAKNWRLQIQINFKAAQDLGTDSWVDQEKAALYNTLVMHDYMVFYGPTPAAGKLWPASYSTQLADSYADDLGKTPAQPMYFCSGHHYSQLKFDNGVAARAYPTNRSDYSRAFHAFHGKLQVYKRDVTAAESADGQAHKKGDLIRDHRGHPKMFGGRGWDSQHNDNNNVPRDPATGEVPLDAKSGQPRAYAWDAAKNDWAPDLYPMDPNGESMLPFGEKAPMDENCLKCHTGPTERSYRDIHHAAGLKCENCHGDMLAVGNAYPNNLFDANLTGGKAYVGETIHFRRPWLDEPNCGSCHVGDGNKDDRIAGYFSDGAKKLAYAEGDKSGASLIPEDARFAVMPHKEERPEKATVNGVTTYVKQPLSQVLYRKSADVHGSGVRGTLTCSTCHGGSHSIWPNPDPNANDNVTAKQLQGYDGNIVECSVCHIKDDFKTGLVATDGGASNLGVAQGVRDGTPVNSSSPRAYLAGPHGMHPINDESWWKEAQGSQANASGTVKGGWHNDFAKKPGPFGEDQCAACHGSDHKGTRLSKALTARQFINEKGKPVRVAAGQQIGCNLCHSLKKSFSGGLPATPVAHKPPAPEPIAVAPAGGGGGGHGH